jgi:hypothetical protein
VAWGSQSIAGVCSEFTRMLGGLRVGDEIIEEWLEVTLETLKSQSLQSAVWVVMGPSVPAFFPTTIVVHLSISGMDCDARTTKTLVSAMLIVRGSNIITVISSFSLSKPSAEIDYG